MLLATARETEFGTLSAYTCLWMTASNEPICFLVRPLLFRRGGEDEGKENTEINPPSVSFARSSMSNDYEMFVRKKANNSSAIHHQRLRETATFTKNRPATKQNPPGDP